MTHLIGRAYNLREYLPLRRRQLRALKHLRSFDSKVGTEGERAHPWVHDVEPHRLDKLERR